MLFGRERFVSLRVSRFTDLEVFWLITAAIFQSVFLLVAIGN